MFLLLLYLLLWQSNLTHVERIDMRRGQKNNNTQLMATELEPLILETSPYIAWHSFALEQVYGGSIDLNMQLEKDLLVENPDSEERLEPATEIAELEDSQVLERKRNIKDSASSKSKKEGIWNVVLKWSGITALAGFIVPATRKLSPYVKQFMQFSLAMGAAALCVAGCGATAWILCDIWLGIAVGIIACKIIPWPSCKQFTFSKPYTKVKSPEVTQSKQEAVQTVPVPEVSANKSKWTTRAWLSCKLNLTKAASSVDSQAKS